MPFSNKRNSRDDNSRKSRGNSDSFKSRGDKNNSFGKKSYGSNDQSERGSFRKDDNRENRSFGSKKFSDKPSFRGDNNSFRSKDNSEKSFGRGGRSFDKNDSSRSFDKKDSFNKFDRSERSFDKKDNFKRSDRNDSSRSFDRSDRPFEKRDSFKRSDRNDSPRSFDRSERSFDKKDNFKRSDRKDAPRSFDRSERSFDKRDNFKRSDRNDAPRSFDRSERSFDKKDNFKRSDRNDSPRSFDRSERSFDKRDNFKRTDRKFDGERSRNFDDNKNFGDKQYIKRPKKKAEDAEDDGLVRLNRYIANAGICSRRKADELITAGVIWVNGEPVTELGTKVDPATDEIRYNNERLKREKNVYVLLNKPKDYITTTDDPQERHTVMELVSKATKERIYPVGRLDRNTTGLLLMTNDGSLAEKLSHPRNSISKIYNVELNKSLTQGDFNKINFGIELEDGVIKPDDLSYVQGGSKREVGIQIHSGKNRIVRRIFESLGYEVVKLDRVVYANLTKKDLPRGRWRYLEEREIVQLKHLI
ncbi:MAG: pseudouridine synthase [Sphingobacterium sp.]|jgi:23S rRNA pseudouridine2605 synthase|uniref:pseudouridine synthase n=1 Tax=unclassified Sphingobacterium TaxID=2609468 RepID=UPI00283DEB2F|nr:pseudouridine synthase [Sphingobacterium sp.]MDR3011229.1 pseudouridine synthase [Sphingobacterium sp.]